MFQEELKKVSLSELEKAIAQAVTALTGQVYTCNIGELNFGVHSAKISLSMAERNPFFGTTEKSEAA